MLQGTGHHTDTDALGEALIEKCVSFTCTVRAELHCAVLSCAELLCAELFCAELFCAEMFCAELC